MMISVELDIVQRTKWKCRDRRHKTDWSCPRQDTKKVIYHRLTLPSPDSGLSYTCWSPIRVFLRGCLLCVCAARLCFETPAISHPTVFVCFKTILTMTSKAAELWIRPAVHCVGAFNQFPKQVAYQENICAMAIDFIVSKNWKCLCLKEMSGFKSDIWNSIQYTAIQRRFWQTKEIGCHWLVIDVPRVVFFWPG